MLNLIIPKLGTFCNNGFEAKFSRQPLHLDDFKAIFTSFGNHFIEWQQCVKSAIQALPYQNKNGKTIKKNLTTGIYILEFVYVGVLFSCLL